VPDPDSRAAELRGWFEGAGVSRFLGQELVSCGQGRAVVRLPVKAEFDQGTGVVHGGLAVTLADTAGYFAAASALPAGRVATVGLSFSFVGPPRGAALVAEGGVIARGRASLVCELRILGVQGETEAVVGVGQAVYRVLDRPREPAP
jgi:uncharacterized protein (TIGR00369 family)